MASVKEMNKKAYFNGTEEPTPGTPKYSVEDTNHLRDNEDRQMKQVSDMGGTDGLFPGDLEKKKMLARAKVDERRSLRAEAVAKAKTAYMQGTTEPVGNGKTQYTPDPIAEKARKEDKQLQNATSFGKDGLAPGDKELKEKLCRAKLKARFVKAARPEMNRWDIISGDKVVLSATFNELTGGRPGLFEQIKTASFAKEMMMNIKNHGLEKAAKLYKSAQAADPLAGLADMNGGAGGAPADPMAGLGGAPDPMAADPMSAMSADPMAGLGAPTGGAEQKLEGVPETVADPVERGKVALEVLEKNVSAFSANVQELINDLKSGQEVVTSQGGALAASGGGEAAAALAAPEQTVTASMKAIQLGASGTKATNELRKIQIVLNAGLNESFKKTIAQLEATKEELDSIAYTLKMPGINSVNRDFVNNLATDATREAGVIIDKAKTLQVAFIKYARGAFGLEKRAAQENRMLKLAADKKKKEKEDEKNGKKSGKAAPVAAPATAPAAKPVAPAAKPVAAPAAKPVPTPAAKPMVGKKASIDDTLEGRNMQRQKLAAKALQMSDMLNQAHPSGSASVGGLDFKSSEAVVEDLEDVHSKMEEVANAGAKGDVKRNAALLNDLIKAGRVEASNLDNLAKHGLDKDAVAYWKKYYGQADGGSEYASELVSDYSKEKTAAVDNEQYKVKLASAYDLAYEMAEAGVVPNNKDAIRQEVESIINWTDEAFQSMKRVVAHRKTTGFTKEAAAIEVGLAYDNNVTSGAPCDTSLLAQLNEAFSGLRLGRQ